MCHITWSWTAEIEVMPPIYLLIENVIWNCINIRYHAHNNSIDEFVLIYGNDYILKLLKELENFCWTERHGLDTLYKEDTEANVFLSVTCQMINSSWPRDAIWRHIFVNRVMAYSPTAPSHYLRQCFIFIGEVLWYSPQSNFSVSAQTTVMYNWFKLACS